MVMHDKVLSSLTLRRGDRNEFHHIENVRVLIGYENRVLYVVSDGDA